MDPPCACQWTPPLRKKKHGPPCQCPPPLERRNMAWAIDTGGGGRCCIFECVLYHTNPSLYLFLFLHMAPCVLTIPKRAVDRPVRKYHRVCCTSLSAFNADFPLMMIPSEHDSAAANSLCKGQGYSQALSLHPNVHGWVVDTQQIISLSCPLLVQCLWEGFTQVLYPKGFLSLGGILGGGKSRPMLAKPAAKGAYQNAQWGEGGVTDLCSSESQWSTARGRTHGPEDAHMGRGTRTGAGGRAQGQG